MITNYDYYKEDLESIGQGIESINEFTQKMSTRLHVPFYEVESIETFNDLFKWLQQRHIEKISYKKIYNQCVYLGTMLDVIKNCEDTDEPYLYLNVMFTEHGKYYHYALRNKNGDNVATYNDTSCRELLPFLMIGTYMNREDILKYVEFD